MEKLHSNFNLMQGTCLLMCPRSESIMRQRENLIHRLECRNPSATNKKMQFSDPQKMVKEYRRSAAGNEIEAVNVRPLSILQKTTKYLLNSVCSSVDVPWNDIYEFVENRLRSVRQDIIVQGLTGTKVAQLLSSLARFYIYSNYQYCECEDANNFDSYLNLKQLHEILSTILLIYNNENYPLQNYTYYQSEEEEVLTPEDFNDSEEEENFPSTPQIYPFTENSSSEAYLSESIKCLTINDPNNDAVGAVPEENYPHYSNIKVIDFGEYSDDIKKSSQENSVESRNPCNEIEEMISLYLLVHLGNSEAIAHVLKVPENIKKGVLLSSVLKATLCWTNGNHLPLIRLAPMLSPILTCALHLHLNKVQRHALIVLASGHSSKNLFYSLEDLQQYLLFNSKESLEKVCNHYGFESSEQGVKFIKSNMKSDVPCMASQKAVFVDEKFRNLSTSEIFFNSIY